jgi:predicted dehydrogenase
VDLRVALVGAGYWGPNYARVLQQMPGAELAAVCDARLDALQRMRELAPHAKAVGSADDVFRDPAIDAVILATPARTHRALGVGALEAGKHLLVEKPLATSRAEAQALADAARAAGRTLMVGHIYAYHPAVEALAKLVRAGELGAPRWLGCVRAAPGPVRSDVNALWDLAPHDLSILDALLGELPERATCTGAAWLQRGVEDAVWATLWFPRGAMAHVEATWLAAEKVRRLTVAGERRTALLDETQAQPLRLFPSVQAGAPQAQPQGEAVPVAKAEPLRAQAEHFVQCVRTGVAPRTGAAEGMRVVATLEALQRALAQGTQEKVVL